MKTTIRQSWRWHVPRLLAVLLLLGGIAGHTAAAARVKDVADLYGIRDNSLVGYGIVTGLNRSGDSTHNEVTIRSLTNRLQGLGVTIEPGDIQARNVAVVMVTATLPPGSRPGHRVSAQVSSVGDAKSLEGGVLQLTPLYAPNGHAYASAQGPIVLGAMSVSSKDGDSARTNLPTVGLVPSGALVEAENENEVKIQDLTQLQWLIRDPDFTTAARVATAIDLALAGSYAQALSAGTVVVTVPDAYKARIVPLIAAIEAVEVEIDAPLKVVVNERTGTVVMGADVRILPVAVAQGGLSIEVRRKAAVSQPSPLGRGTTEVVHESTIKVEEKEGRLTMIDGTTVGELVGALDTLGVTPRDLIQILLAIQRAGALQAELEVM